MDAFLLNISSYPTIIFSVGLVVICGFWLLSLIGLFDVDAFDVGVDLEFETDLDVSQVGGVAGLLTSLGLTGVPITVVLSLLILNSWFLCYFASALIPTFPDLVSFIQIAIHTGIAILSFIIAIPITATMIKPLKGIFKRIHQEPLRVSLLGSQCRIRSTRADNSFGQAEAEHYGASLIVKVRTSGDLVLKTGDIAVIIEHNESDDSYLVVTKEEFNKNQN
ncbi:MAG: hypothetical protein ABJI60_14860 [Kangiellaceae bacterium]|jgi:hypothetical protein